ncbi:MAG: hypothetical protein R3C05_25490 [Pirellulaceae bacterium]
MPQAPLVDELPQADVNGDGEIEFHDADIVLASLGVMYSSSESGI